MRSLRYSILALAVCFGFFLIVGRTFGDVDNPSGFQSFVFGLAGAGTLLAVALPTVRKISPLVWLAGWLAAFGAGKLILAQGEPVPSSYAIYLALTELTFLFLCAFLAWRLSSNLAEPEELLAKVILPDVSRRVRQIEEAGEEIKTEFIRSRRNNLTISVMLVAADPASIKASLNRTIKEMIQSLFSRYVTNSLIQLVDKELRRTDLILEQPGSNQLVLLLKDTDSSGTSLLAERIQQLSNMKLGVNVHCSFATFPNEALTFEELVNQAESFLPDQQQYKELLRLGKEAEQEFHNINQAVQ